MALLLNAVDYASEDFKHLSFDPAVRKRAKKTKKPKEARWDARVLAQLVYREKLRTKDSQKLPTSWPFAHVNITSSTLKPTV
jgi:hypothetical protein